MNDVLRVLMYANWKGCIGEDIAVVCNSDGEIVCIGNTVGNCQIYCNVKNIAECECVGVIGDYIATGIFNDNGEFIMDDVTSINYEYGCVDGYDYVEFVDHATGKRMEIVKMTNTKTNTKAMEKLTAMGFTIEPATAEHIKEVKANMPTEKPEIIEIHDLNEKARTESHCNFKMYDPKKINMHIGYKPVISHDFTKEKSVMKSVSACKRIIKNSLALPAISTMHDAYYERKKAEYIATTEKIKRDRQIKAEAGKKLASEKAKENYNRLKSFEVVLNVSAVDVINDKIKERKPEKANIYSCKANTLETSIDYTTTDLKDLERLNNKKAKIENTLDTFELLEKSKIEKEIDVIKRKAVKRTDKNLVKHSNKSLKDVTDYAKEAKARNEELTKQAKSTTNRSEFIAYSKKFKKAFRNVVNEEYSENCRDASVKLSALHEKQKALDEKRKALKIKIAACDSVISQLTKTDPNKINYSLINSKLDIIGIGLTEYSLKEIQAIKTSISDTYNKVISAIDNCVADIKALTNLNSTYSKIRNGKEIKIDVTTKSLDKNIFFSVVVGYDINKNNSTYAILHIRQLTEKTLEKMNITDYVIDVNYNVFRNNSADVKLALSRQITKRQAYNMIARQGSKTQYNIYHCAMRNDFDDHDTADIYSVAYTQLLNCLSTKNADDIATAKKVINVVNSKIQHLNKYNDCHVIEKYVSTANKALKDVYKIEFLKATSDYNRNKSVITLLENMYTAISEKSVKALKTSCYNKINTYLTSIRAIREKSDIENLDSVIESETERFYTLFEDNQEVEYSEKSTILKMCYSAMKKCLNKDALKVFELMGKGYSTTQIAEKKKVDKSAISHQIAEIKQAFLKCYADIKNSAENTHLFANNPIVFDPAVFADCKPISDKTEKIINTYNRNAEIDRIKNAVNSSSSAKENIKIEFEKYVKTKLRDIDIQIINVLIDDTSVRDTAKTLDIDMNVVKRTKLKITSKIYELIEKHCNITVNKNDLKKVNLSVLFDIVKIA